MDLALIKLYVFYLLASASVQTESSEQRFCSDDKCSEPISLAITTLTYNKDRPDKLSFKNKEEVRVYSKPLDSTDDLWYVDINGKKGYVSRTFLKETKVYKRQNDVVNKHNPLSEREEVITKVISDFNKTITPQETTVETQGKEEEIANEEVSDIDIESDEEDGEKEEEAGEEEEEEIMDGQGKTEKPREKVDNIVETQQTESVKTNENVLKETTADQLIVKENNVKPVATTPDLNLVTPDSIPATPDSIPPAPDSIPPAPGLIPATPDPITVAPVLIPVTPVSIPATPDLIPVTPDSITAIPDPVTFPPDTVPVTPDSIPFTPNSIASDDFSSFDPKSTYNIVAKEEKPNIIDPPPKIEPELQIQPNKIENVVDGTTLYSQFEDQLMNFSVSDFEDAAHLTPNAVPPQTAVDIDIQLDLNDTDIYNNASEALQDLRETATETLQPAVHGHTHYGFYNQFPSSYASNVDNVKSDPPSEESHDAASLITDPPSDKDIPTPPSSPVGEENSNDATNILSIFDTQSETPSKSQSNSVNSEAFEGTEEANSQLSFLESITNLLDFKSFLSVTSLYSGDSYSTIGVELLENSETFGMSARMMLFLFLVSASVLTFTLGYYYLDIRRQDGKLVAMVNSLQKDLLCYTKECDMLKDELSVTKEKLAGIEDSSFGTDEMVISLKKEIHHRNIKVEDLEKELEKAVKELNSTTRAAEQLQSFIDEVLQWKDQTKIEEDMGNIDELQDENAKLVEELEMLRKAEDAHNNELKTTKKLYEDATNTLKIQQHEIDSLKEALQGLQGTEVNSEKLSNIIDNSEIRAQLKNALQERDMWASQIQNEQFAHSIIETELKTTIESLQKSEQTATRLGVLCDHFKKREADLVKELSAKEALWLSTQGETMTTVEKLQTLQTEVQQYKDMCSELRAELAAAEAARRSAEAEAEKRAHAVWLEARAARRDADAHRADAAALRRRLGADAAPSPPPAPTMPPPLPLLPPLPPPPPLARPPPLGRHPSPPFPPPPPHRPPQASPPPRYSEYISDRNYPERGRSPYSPTRRIHQRRRSYSNERYYEGERRNSRGSHHMTETETDYSPPLSPRRRRSLRSPRHGPSSESDQSYDSDK